MGAARTQTVFTPIRDRRFKQHLLSERREEVLAGEGALLPLLERAALRVEEDLCLLRFSGGSFVLVAACLCSPSRWVLAEKLGKPLGEIHGRVPGYAEELVERVDGFLGRLRPGTVVARRNWTIHETSERFEPVPPARLGLAPAEQWLRSERQTLQRLPRSGALLFTIRTDMVQLRDVPAGTRRALARRLAAEPAELTAYRGLGEVRDWLAAWLRTA